VLILTPTRELAAQVASNINDFAKYLDITTLTIVGGGKQDVQAKKLKAGAHIIVATPGRLLEHLTACNLSLSGVETLVLDEADRILDMGFSADVQQIRRRSTRPARTCSSPPPSRGGEKAGQPHAGQTPGGGRRQAELHRRHREPHRLSGGTEAQARAALELIGKQNWQQVLVFASTRESCDELVEELNLDGIKSAVVHGDKAQGSRRRALREFTEGKLRVLVATEWPPAAWTFRAWNTWSTMICRSSRKITCTVSAEPVALARAAWPSPSSVARRSAPCWRSRPSSARRSAASWCRVTR
jgi:superfamily II DNA/RNA helicase